MQQHPILRVARPVADLDATTRFYCEGLGLTVLSEFKDHDGFCGVMLGLPGAPYHFEFTTAPHAEHPIPAPHADDLLVFYLPEPGRYQAAIERIEASGGRAVPSLNPWWDEGGRTYQDPDNRRVVLTGRLWSF